MTAPPPYSPPPFSTQPNLGTQLARASWMAPLIGVGLNIITGPQATTRSAKLVIGFASFAIYILGLAFGIAALVMIRRFGRNGILVPGIIGVVINGLLVLVFIAVIAVAMTLR
jgi:hypothetical protein